MHASYDHGLFGNLCFQKGMLMACVFKKKIIFFLISFMREGEGEIDLDDWRRSLQLLVAPLST